MAFAQAALGAVINVGLLEGGTTELQIAPGTQHGEIMRVPGFGAPLLRSPERRGDLVIILQLVVPRKLDETQRELLNQFAETESLEVDHKSPGFWSRIKDTFS
jgi:molecular chaperone DnaJ